MKQGHYDIVGIAVKSEILIKYCNCSKRNCSELNCINLFSEILNIPILNSLTIHTE